MVNHCPSDRRMGFERATPFVGIFKGQSPLKEYSFAQATIPNKQFLLFYYIISKKASKIYVKYKLIPQMFNKNIDGI